MSTIGENIKKLRGGETQEKFAAKAGISRSYLSALENNDKNPTTETLRKLSEKLGVSVAYLLEGKKTPAEMTDLEQKEYVKELKSKSHNQHGLASVFLERDIISHATYDELLLILEDWESLDNELIDLLSSVISLHAKNPNDWHLHQNLVKLIDELNSSDQPTLKDKEIILDQKYENLKKQYLRSEVSHKKPLSDPSFPFSNED